MLKSSTVDLAAFLAAHEPLADGASFANGTVIGGWCVTAFLGRGGSGEVYRVEKGRTAALKILAFPANASEESRETARRRFRREAEFLARNEFPFFPKLFAEGETEDGYPFVVMELLESRPLPSRDRAVAAFLLQVCTAVRTLHRRGLVHRDIKPGNILARTNGEIVLIDLGLLKETTAAPGHTGATVTLADGRAVGAGTPHYAAPEQFGGGEVSAQSDIHALGVLIDDCFGGKPPRCWGRIVRRATSSLPKLRYYDVDALMCAIRFRLTPSIFFWAGLVAFAALAAWWWWTVRPVVTPAEVAALFRDNPRSALELRQAMEGAEDYDEAERWRALCENVVTNGRIATVVRLNGEVHAFSRPIVLSNDREWLVVGPGTLDADVTGADTNESVRVRLDHCVFLNRTRKPAELAAVRYHFAGGAYLNFIDQEPNQSVMRFASRYAEGFDAQFDAVEFGGPPTNGGLNEKRQTEIDTQLRRADAAGW